jgi:hypothetical protein
VCTKLIRSDIVSCRSFYFINCRHGAYDGWYCVAYEPGSGLIVSGVCAAPYDQKRSIPSAVGL